MQRSLSITVIAILQGFISVTSLATGMFLGLLITGTVQVFSQDLTALSLPLKGLVALGLAISLFGLVVTYGLWHLKTWGWMGSLMFQMLCIVNNGLAVLAGQSVTGRVYFSTVFCIALIGALWVPSVRNGLVSSSER
jgi:hypothetical protein